MLVLSRKIGQRIHIGDSIVLTVVQIQGTNTVRVGIEAPPEVAILREELRHAADPVAPERPRAVAS